MRRYELRQTVATLQEALSAAKSNAAVAKAAGVSDKTVAAVRTRMEDGSEIPSHNKRVGADGVAQPARKPGLRPGGKSFADPGCGN